MALAVGLPGTFTKLKAGPAHHAGIVKALADGYAARPLPTPAIDDVLLHRLARARPPDLSVPPAE